MDATTNDPAQADQDLWVAPSLLARTVSIAGLAALVFDLVLLRKGQFEIAQFVALAIFWATVFVAPPPDAGEPECLDDRSHIDWKSDKVGDMRGFILVGAFIIGMMTLAWYFDRRVADLAVAICFAAAATYQSVVLAYRVWWKRRLPA